ncbi:MAG: ABC transporter permease [Myxococcales bacterium FL481]|nr:MAG: ABC transporter permease [Myxococcales bacterium FL481]
MKPVKRQIERLGSQLSALIIWVGGVGLMFTRALVRGPRPPWGISDIAYQILQAGVRSLPMATLMSVFLGMIFSWQFGEALADFGAVNTLGTVGALALVRELVPAILAVTVGAKMATGMTAELGSMKVSEQIDAISSMGADPIKKLVWPRLVATTVALPLLIGWGNIAALFGGMLIGDVVFDVAYTYFYDTFIDELELWHYTGCMVKAVVFGMIAGTIGCYQGFTTRFGTEAVGLSTTETVVATTIAVVIADFALTTVFVQV